MWGDVPSCHRLAVGSSRLSHSGLNEVGGGSRGDECRPAARECNNSSFNCTFLFDFYGCMCVCVGDETSLSPQGCCQSASVMCGPLSWLMLWGFVFISALLFCADFSPGTIICSVVDRYLAVAGWVNAECDWLIFLTAAAGFTGGVYLTRNNLLRCLGVVAGG